jgi:sugar O-acyltransferase (sialic acid O-acetyltransferase NeuD family)
LAIVGSGGLGQLIAHHVVGAGSFELTGFFDDFERRETRVGLGIVLGTLDQIGASYREGLFDEALIGVGYKHFDFRKELFHRLKQEVPMAQFVHPNAFVDQTCRIGEGSVVLPGCILDRNVRLGENVFMNIGCMLAHDSAVGDHSFLAPGVRTAGFASIGERCFVGVGTTISNRVQLCNGSKTGAGAVLIQDTTRPEFYVGVPARCVAGSDGSGSEEG